MLMVSKWPFGSKVTLTSRLSREVVWLSADVLNRHYSRLVARRDAVFFGRRDVMFPRPFFLIVFFFFFSSFFSKLAPAAAQSSSIFVPQKNLRFSAKLMFHV